MSPDLHFGHDLNRNIVWTLLCDIERWGRGQAAPPPKLMNDEGLIGPSTVVDHRYKILDRLLVKDLMLK